MATSTETSPVRSGSSGLRRLRRWVVVHAPWKEAQLEPRTWELEAARILVGRDAGPEHIELGDGQASRPHAELVHLPAIDAYRLRDLGSKNGTFVDGVLVEEAVLAPGNVVRIGQTLSVYAEIEVPSTLSKTRFLQGGALARARAEVLADLAARDGRPILITGPTGAGKEVLARRIHEQSGRSGPMVAVNCAALSRDLAGSELFGHVRGAFTGAHQDRAGTFVTARGGTVFLDEIGDLAGDLQPALLRALQEKRVRPLGSDAEIEVDVRVVAATNVDLGARVDQGLFRSDLYARLAGVLVELPGLRARREEILALFARFSGVASLGMSSEAAEALLLYGWPRNIRELMHVAANARLLAPDGGEIDLAALPPSIRGARPSEPDAPPAAAADPSTITRDELADLLRRSNGNVAAVARALGVGRQLLYKLFDKHRLTAAEFRGPK